jgi:hypothetical protein
MNKEVSKEIEVLHKMAGKYLQEGLCENEITEILKKQGLEDFYAKKIIENVLLDKQRKRSFWLLLFGGILVIAVGFGLNYYSYKMASTSNTSFFHLFWGIMVVGLIMIIRAFILFKK